MNARAKIIAPMFVVARTGDRAKFSRSSALPGWHPPLGDVPVLGLPRGRSRSSGGQGSGCMCSRRGVLSPKRTGLAVERICLYNSVIRGTFPRGERFLHMAKTGSKGDSKGKSDEDGFKIVARNRCARFEYDLLETVEAGIVLTGTEVKSLRSGKASLEEAYAGMDHEEVWLFGCDIPEYLQANRMNHKPKRPRKLLLHRCEIDKLEGEVVRARDSLRAAQDLLQERHREGGNFRRQGPKHYDKRDVLKKQDAKRDMDRASRPRLKKADFCVNCLDRLGPR